MVAGMAGLESARVVRTPAFAELDDIGAFVVRHAEILSIDGDPGVGKTTLTTDWASRQSVPVTPISLPPKQSSRDIVRLLHAAIAADTDMAGLSERDLQDDLVALLESPRVFVIRNVQRLSAEAAGQLEWLHSHPRAAFALVLEGGPGTAAAIERDALLRGRIARTLTVPALRGRVLLDTLRNMHDLFLAADADLLVEIDTRVCRGVLRHWGRFLQSAIDLQHQAATAGRPVPVLDRTFAKAVLATLPATMTRKRA